MKMLLIVLNVCKKKKYLINMKDKLKVCMMSDIHGNLIEPTRFPECDVIGFCGDTVPLEYQNDTAQSIAWFCLEFVPWTDKLPCKYVVFIAGNHDFFLQDLTYYKKGNELKTRTAQDVIRRLLPGNNKAKHKLIYLCDNSVEIEGKRIYGSPWIGDLKNWAFYKSPEDIVETWKNIPKNCDILMTHQPPKMCDMGVVHEACFNYFADWGSEELANVLQEKNIRYAFCGHVHSGNHNLVEYKNGCHVVNVSLLNEDYKPTFFQYEIPIYEI